MPGIEPWRSQLWRALRERRWRGGGRHTDGRGWRRPALATIGITCNALAWPASQEPARAKHAVRVGARACAAAQRAPPHLWQRTRIAIRLARQRQAHSGHALRPAHVCAPAAVTAGAQVC